MSCKRVCLFLMFELIVMVPIILMIYWLLALHTEDFKGENMRVYLHGVVMLFAFTYVLAQGIALLRVCPVSKGAARVTHATANSLVLIFGIAGLILIMSYKTDQGKPHLYSIHSWCGLLLLIILLIQFTGGSIVLQSCCKGATIKTRLNYAPTHVAMGIASLLLAAICIVSGIINLKNYLLLEPTGELEARTLNYENTLLNLISASSLLLFLLIVCVTVSRRARNSPDPTRHHNIGGLKLNFKDCDYVANMNADTEKKEDRASSADTAYGSGQSQRSRQNSAPQRRDQDPHRRNSAPQGRMREDRPESPPRERMISPSSRQSFRSQREFENRSPNKTDAGPRSRSESQFNQSPPPPPLQGPQFNMNRSPPPLQGQQFNRSPSLRGPGPQFNRSPPPPALQGPQFNRSPPPPALQGPPRQQSMEFNRAPHHTPYIVPQPDQAAYKHRAEQPQHRPEQPPFHPDMDHSYQAPYRDPEYPRDLPRDLLRSHGDAPRINTSENSSPDIPPLFDAGLSHLRASRVGVPPPLDVRVYPGEGYPGQDGTLSPPVQFAPVNVVNPFPSQYGGNSQIPGHPEPYKPHPDQYPDQFDTQSPTTFSTINQPPTTFNSRAPSQRQVARQHRYEARRAKVEMANMALQRPVTPPASSYTESLAPHRPCTSPSALSNDSSIPDIASSIISDDVDGTTPRRGRTSYRNAVREENGSKRPEPQPQDYRAAPQDYRPEPQDYRPEPQDYRQEPQPQDYRTPPPPQDYRTAPQINAKSTYQPEIETGTNDDEGICWL